MALYCGDQGTSASDFTTTEYCLQLNLCTLRSNGIPQRAVFLLHVYGDFRVQVPIHL